MLGTTPLIKHHVAYFPEKIAFVHYDREINSSELVKRLVDKYSTYVVPGDHFGRDHYLRISYGLSDDYVNEGLRRIYETISSPEML